MRHAERLFIYSAVLVAILLALGSRLPGGSTAVASAQADSKIRIASVDVYTIVETMLRSDTYAAARERGTKERTDPLRPMFEELRSINAKLQVLPPTDPERQTIIQQAQARQQELQSAQQQAQEAIELLSANQLIEVYALVRAAVHTVAAREGYTHVFASRVADAKIDSKTLPAAVQELLARPLLKGTEGADNITQAVRAELKLN